MEQIEPIRVAQIMGKWLGGGVEAVIMNYYRHIDRNKIQFDFICDEDSTNIPYEEIESLGGRVIICPPYQKLPRYIKELKRIFKENNYKIVHSNINTLSVFPLYAAKKARVKVRIAHSHSTTSPKEFKRNIMKNVLKHFSKLYATDYFACSEKAGRYQFGNKAFDSGKVTIINNAIDVGKYKFNADIRKKVRNELGIDENTLVIGHVGRFVTVKNHKFIIKLFNEFLKSSINSKLILIGDGPLKGEIENLIDSLKIHNKVMLLGQREDVERFYQAMDILIFPSLYEGFGNVLLEAQCSYLPCVCSSNVPSLDCYNDNLFFISLDAPIEDWINSILIIKNSNRMMQTKLQNSNFDILVENNKLVDSYLERLKKCQKLVF